LKQFRLPLEVGDSGRKCPDLWLHDLTMAALFTVAVDQRERERERERE